MKTKMIFEGDFIEDKEMFEQLFHAGDYRGALYEIDQHLRSIVKYGEDKDQQVDAQELRDRLRAICEDYGISIS